MVHKGTLQLPIVRPHAETGIPGNRMEPMAEGISGINAGKLSSLKDVAPTSSRLEFSQQIACSCSLQKMKNALRRVSYDVQAYRCS
jgi:hypothetical protein